MDNFFDYIVILFFIVSAIASMLKSKKKEEAKKKAAEVQTRSSVTKPQLADRNKSEYQTYAEKPSTADLQYENKATRTTDTYSTDTQEDENYEQKKRGYSLNEMKSEVEKYFEEAIAKSKLTEEPAPPPKPPSPPAVEHKSDAVPESYLRKKAIKDIHVESRSIVNKRAEDIRRRIKDTTELQDLIVINEILNKPKAYRKGR